MGKAKMMTNLPVFSGHISANEGALPVKFRLQLADACPPLWCKKKIFVTATLIRLKLPTTHKKVLQYMVGMGHNCLIGRMSKPKMSNPIMSNIGVIDQKGL